MASKEEWEDVSRQILEALDIEAECRTLGVRFSASSPTAAGWLSCHAVDRADEHPSAAVNVSAGELRGRYTDRASPLRMSFWDLAARLGGHGDWKRARKYYADKLAIRIPTGAEPKNPRDLLDFSDWSTTSARAYCNAKGAITPDAIKAAGGRLASFPADKPRDKRQFVIAFPVFNGPLWADGLESGWVIAPQDGKNLVFFQKKGGKEYRKTSSVKGTVGGLMNTFALQRIAEAQFIWKVEGLSDMLAVQSIIPPELRDKHIVITNSQGTMERVKPEWMRLLAKKKVFIIHDADKPGQIGANSWCDLLLSVGSEVHNVQLPYTIEENHGKDIRNWINEGHSYAELIDLADATPLWAASSDVPAVLPPASMPSDPMLPGLGDDGARIPPPPGSPPGAAAPAPGGPDPLSPEALNRRECENAFRDIGLVVLGKREKAVEVFSLKLRQGGTINNLKNFCHRDLISICGESAMLKVHSGKEDEPGRYSFDFIANAISLFSAENNLTNRASFGQGCWQPDESGSIYIVDQKALYSYEPGTTTLREIESPLVGKHVFDLDAPEYFCDFGKLSEYLGKATVPGWGAKVIERTQEVFREWNWTYPVDSTVLTGLVMVAWLQTLWPWRPLVAITGSTNAGKSTFLQHLCYFFGKLSHYFAKTTEAGFRQALGFSATIPIIDEFEADQHRKKVLDLFRAASRGASITRGTSDQKGREFRVRHMPWVAAIESGLQRDADRNRFIVLDLQGAPRGRLGHFKVPTPAELGDRGLQLLALALYNFNRSKELAKALKSTIIGSVHPRVIENYAVVASCLASAQGMDEAGARSLLEKLVSDRYEGTPEIADEKELMRQLLHGLVDCGHGVRMSVAEIISNQEHYQQNGDALERCGFALGDGHAGSRSSDLKSKKHIFFFPELAKSRLLGDRHPRWGEMDVATILIRLPKAEKKQRSLSGQRVWGIQVPYGDWITYDEEKSAKSGVGDSTASSKESVGFDKLEMDLDLRGS